MEDIFKFYPVEHRELKSLDKNSKLYKKKLFKFMQNFNVFGMVLSLEENDPDYSFKLKYNTNIKKVLIWLAIFIFVNIIELFANEIRGVFYWTDAEILHFIRYMLEFFISLSVTMVYSFKARNVLLEYLAHLIDTTPIKCPNLSIEEVFKLMNIFKTAPEYMDTNLKFACIDCLEKFERELKLSEKINGDFEVNTECPKCNSQYIFYYSGKLEKEFLNNLHEFWF